MHLSGYSCEVFVTAEATFIYFDSGNSGTATFSASGSATAIEIEYMKQLGKQIGNKLFINLFKDLFFNDSFIIVRFTGVITLKITSPSDTVQTINIPIIIDKGNFPTEIIKNIADFFASYTVTYSSSINDLLKLVGMMLNVPIELVNDIIYPLDGGIIDESSLGKLFQTIITTPEYVNMVKKYISNADGIDKATQNFINLLNSSTIIEDKNILIKYLLREFCYVNMSGNTSPTGNT